MLPREPIFHRNFPHTHRRSFTGSLAPPCSTNKRLRAILRACEKEDVDRDSTSSVHRRRSRKTEQTTDSDSWRWKSHSKTGQLSSCRHDFSLFSVRVSTVRSHLSCQTHERAQMNGAGNLRYDFLCSLHDIRARYLERPIRTSCKSAPCSTRGAHPTFHRGRP